MLTKLREQTIHMKQFSSDIQVFLGTRQNTDDAGEHIRDIPVSGPPNDIAVIDAYRIVVTYGDALFIEILNNNTFNVEKKIRLQKNCWGASHADGKLYVVHGDSIQVLDLSGRQMKTMKTASKSVSRIYTNSDKIVYSDVESNIVHCCDLNGEELWQLKNNSIDFPRCVTADNSNNVFVVSYFSDNLTIIQHDGKNCKTLLTKSDGLNRPKAVDFDKDKRTLLIFHKERKVSLFKVV
ncbi:unnamed protein product [Mytilus coruscus]|uniref:TRIM71 n=1 Tax=Mytilus coruscus TaxID=42192 RepID=A0A6J8DN97_MYTCO|nr:unnamed protein product [Mytilus coruscus]